MDPDLVDLDLVAHVSDQFEEEEEARKEKFKYTHEKCIDLDKS